MINPILLFTLSLAAHPLPAVCWSRSSWAVTQGPIWRCSAWVWQHGREHTSNPGGVGSDQQHTDPLHLRQRVRICLCLILSLYDLFLFPLLSYFLGGGFLSFSVGQSWCACPVEGALALCDVEKVPHMRGAWESQLSPSGPGRLNPVSIPQLSAQNVLTG